MALHPFALQLWIRPAYSQIILPVLIDLMRPFSFQTCIFELASIDLHIAVRVTTMNDLVFRDPLEVIINIHMEEGDLYAILVLNIF